MTNFGPKWWKNMIFGFSFEKMDSNYSKNIFGIIIKRMVTKYVLLTPNSNISNFGSKYAKNAISALIRAEIGKIWKNSLNLYFLKNI